LYKHKHSIPPSRFGSHLCQPNSSNSKSSSSSRFLELAPPAIGSPGIDISNSEGREEGIDEVSDDDGGDDCEGADVAFVAEGMPEGLVDVTFAADGMLEGLVDVTFAVEGMPEGIPEGMSEGMPEGIPEGMSEGMSEGISVVLPGGPVSWIEVGGRVSS
jgi:hypothetical protein